MVHHQHDNGSDNGNHKTVEIQASDSGGAEGVEQPPSSNSSDDTENQIQNQTRRSRRSLRRRLRRLRRRLRSQNQNLSL